MENGMALIRDTAQDVFSEGSSSNPDKPFKDKIRRLFGLVEDTIAALPQGYDVSYETRSELFADLNWSSGKIGRVFGDGTASFNGIYKKSGSSGSGSWSKIGPLPGGDTSGLQAQVDAIDDTVTAQVPVVDTLETTRRRILRENSGRPGDNVDRYTNDLDGAPSALDGAPVVVSDYALGQATTSVGRVARWDGGGTTAQRNVDALEVGRLYQYRFVVRKVLTASDARVRTALRLLDQNYAGVATIVLSDGAVATGDGRVERTFTVALDDGQNPTADFLLPVTTVYARPFVQTFGSDGRIDLEVIERIDLTNVGGSAAEEMAAIYPGRSPLLFTTDVTDPAALSKRMGLKPTRSADGLVVKLTGYVSMGRRDTTRIEPGRLYKARAAVRRAINSRDPVGDGVQLRVAWFDSAGALISESVAAEVDNLLVTAGRVALSRDIGPWASGTPLSPPAGTTDARAYVRCYGDSHTETYVELVGIVEAVENGLVGPAGPAGGPLADGDYGDVVVSGGGTVWSLIAGLIGTFLRGGPASANTQAEFLQAIGLGSAEGRLYYASGSLKNDTRDDIESSIYAFERAKGTPSIPQNVETASILGKMTWAGWLGGDMRYAYRDTVFVHAIDAVNNRVSAKRKFNVTDLATGTDWAAFHFSEQGYLGIGDTATLTENDPACSLDVSGLAAANVLGHRSRVSKTLSGTTLTVSGSGFVHLTAGGTLTDIVTTDPYAPEVFITLTTGTLTITHNSTKIRCRSGADATIVANQGGLRFKKVPGSAIWDQVG